MAQEQIPDNEVEGWLKALGVESLCHWDVLTFLYGHQTSMVGPEHLSRLLGYPTKSILAVLDALEQIGLVERSRLSQGTRLYQFIMPNKPPHSEAFERLLALSSLHGGRLRTSL